MAARARPAANVLHPAALAPSDAGTDELAALAAGCQACDLWARATQTVFGAGPAPAPLLLVGEQPGDSEDLAGKAFVGPAGKLLDRALAEAGIARASVYLTNAVKHFKWEPRGKRRIHERPNTGEIRACRPWLEAEVRAVRPQLIVCLGAVAAQSVFGAPVKVQDRRGTFSPSPLGPEATVTLHPSAVLRSRDDASRDEQLRSLVADLVAAAHHIATR
jgi:DNA polymerase